MNDMYLTTVPPRYEAFCNEYPAFSLCRVVQQEKGRYLLASPLGTLQARVSGKFKYEVKTVSDFPVVGDYVMADLNADGTTVIHTVLPRKSVFLRKAAGRAKTEQPGGVTVIDTPGMRELGLWDAEEGLSAAFADVETLAARCRFKDCTHQTEPGCAVRAALERGELSEKRLLSHQKLRAENARSEDAEAFRTAKEKKFKQIAKFNKTNSKK